MCFRLYAAVSSSDRAGPAPDLGALSVAAGLDVRVHADRFLEVGWGDCACSLYTRKDGRARVVALIEKLVACGATVDLLLVVDGEAAITESTEPLPIPLERFRIEGLTALPEGRGCRLVPEPRDLAINS